MCTHTHTHTHTRVITLRRALHTRLSCFQVLKQLDTAKSTYCTPFAKLCKEVFIARIEANDNVKYLRTLETWFDRLSRGDSFPDLVQLFKPVRAWCLRACGDPHLTLFSCCSPA